MGIDVFLIMVAHRKLIGPMCELTACSEDSPHAYKTAGAPVAQSRFVTIVLAPPSGPPRACVLRNQPSGALAPANWGARRTSFITRCEKCSAFPLRIRGRRSWSGTNPNGGIPTRSIRIFTFGAWIRVSPREEPCTSDRNPLSSRGYSFRIRSIGSAPADASAGRFAERHQAYFGV